MACKARRMYLTVLRELGRGDRLLLASAMNPNTVGLLDSSSIEKRLSSAQHEIDGIRPRQAASRYHKPLRGGNSALSHKAHAALRCAYLAECCLCVWGWHWTC